MTSTDPRRPWRTGHLLLLVVPLIGGALVATHPPTWLQVVGVIAILFCVAAGSTLLRRTSGAWRPSATLDRQHDDGR